MGIGTARFGDPVSCPICVHGWTSFPALGNFTAGSLTVYTNDRPTVRLGDGGVHVACMGPNTFVSTTGDPLTLVNDCPIVRGGDATLHCGINPGVVLPAFVSLNTI